MDSAGRLTRNKQIRPTTSLKPSEPISCLKNTPRQIDMEPQNGKCGLDD